MSLLELKNVSKIYGDLKALDSVNVHVDKGEWVAIMGPSGSGVDIAKESSKKLTDIRRDKIGLIFQQFHMVNYLTAVENVMVSQYYHSMPDEQEALEALGRVGLRERAHHLPSQLSGGEQQRVCVARALINHPELNIVLDLFAQLHAEGTTLIVVTHDPEVADAAQRTIVLEHGKVAREVINEHFDEQQKEWLARLKTENKR